METMETVMEVDEALDFPHEVNMLCSALETGQYAASERRARVRRSHRTLARLRLFTDEAGAGPTVLYTRDVDSRGLGFLTRRRLPLGYGGTLDLLVPDGRLIRIPVTLIRCRLVAPGWYDGAVSFNREQADFK